MGEEKRGINSTSVPRSRGLHAERRWTPGPLPFGRGDGRPPSSRHPVLFVSSLSPLLGSTTSTPADRASALSPPPNAPRLQPSRQSVDERVGATEPHRLKANRINSIDTEGSVSDAGA
ncbi:hypothetical protein SKAU_G00356240 [Synaphobranchus kaupii]|uniref:Uncharacterized protein n=1 Tax=Synaphobranchus kaupii TaxID=118154 RepID=A0A9Q1EHE5_SYNKA|nr:hypothetical protein SKAU_G00356240 [Synaphobranchus kaupii]